MGWGKIFPLLGKRAISIAGFFFARCLDIRENLFTFIAPRKNPMLVTTSKFASINIVCKPGVSTSGLFLFLHLNKSKIYG